MTATFRTLTDYRAALYAGQTDALPLFDACVDAVIAWRHAEHMESLRLSGARLSLMALDIADQVDARWNDLMAALVAAGLDTSDTDANIPSDIDC